MPLMTPSLSLFPGVRRQELLPQQAAL